MSTPSHTMYLLEKDATITDALAVITENKRGAVLIVDTDTTLIGVVSDGDIRRALVKGATTMTPIEKVVNHNVVSVKKTGDSAHEAEVIFSERNAVNLVPVLDSANRVCDVIARS